MNNIHGIIGINNIKNNLMCFFGVNGDGYRYVNIHWYHSAIEIHAPAFNIIFLMKTIRCKINTYLVTIKTINIWKMLMYKLYREKR